MNKFICLIIFSLIATFSFSFNVYACDETFFSLNGDQINDKKTIYEGDTLFMNIKCKNKNKKTFYYFNDFSNSLWLLENVAIEGIGLSNDDYEIILRSSKYILIVLKREFEGELNIYLKFKT